MLEKQEVEQLINAIRDGVKAANGTLPAEGITVAVSVRNPEGAVDTASFKILVTEQDDQVQGRIDNLIELAGVQLAESKALEAKVSTLVEEMAKLAPARPMAHRAETAFDRLRAAARRRRDDERLRGTGRTSGGILQTIADALFAPGRWIEFKDHSGRSAPVLAEAISRMVRQLNLRIDVVSTRRHSDDSRHILVRSTLSPVRLQRGQELRVVNPNYEVHMHSVVSVHSE